MTWNPLRRSPIRKKPRSERRSAPWRAPKIRLDAKGMAALRSEAYARSEGICECNREICKQREMRLRRVTWYDGQLHHVISRGRGGSDTLENVIFVTRQCHDEITGQPKWGLRRNAS